MKRGERYLVQGLESISDVMFERGIRRGIELCGGQPGDVLEKRLDALEICISLLRGTDDSESFKNGDVGEMWSVWSGLDSIREVPSTDGCAIVLHTFMGVLRDDI